MHTARIDPSQDQRLARPNEGPPARSGSAPAASIIHAPCAIRSAASPAIRARQAGFTLIEMLIGVAVAGALSSVALPSFEGQLQKARRADALVSMMQIQAAQERFRSNSTSYGTLAQIGVPGTSAARHYTLQTSGASADGYEAVATATGTQARDSACLHMKLSLTGMNPVYASGPDPSVSNSAAANRKCWSL